MKWFHAIGASGKATANVCKMFKDMGWFVTGSDSQFIPPASDIIKNNDIPFDLDYVYYHLDKEFWEMKLNRTLDIPTHPDLLLLVESITPKNKEYLYAKKLGLDVRPFSEILHDYLVKDESVVVIGTAGKTTTTTLITKILREMDLDPSFMIGADVIDFDESIGNTNSNWSVIEGDEYHSPTLSKGAKFLQYKPKYLLITKVSWEHQDIFETEERYVEEFAKCLKLLPSNGLIVAKHGDSNIDKVLESNINNVKVIRYSFQNNENEVIEGIYNIVKVSSVNSVTSFKIFNNSKQLVFEGETTLLGDYNLENILSSYIIVNEIPELKNILNTKSNNFLQNIFSDFKGPKKRLQKLKVSNDLVIIDDFGVTPERAFNSINTLKANFPDFELVGIYEPNSGSRPSNLELFNKMYKESFNNSNLIIIPELSTTNTQLINGEDVVNQLKTLGFNTIFIQQIDIPKYLKDLYLKNRDKNIKTLFVFFSSYRLTEMANNLSKELN